MSILVQLHTSAFPNPMQALQMIRSIEEIRILRGNNKGEGSPQEENITLTLRVCRRMHANAYKAFCFSSWFFPIASVVLLPSIGTRHRHLIDRSGEFCVNYLIAFSLRRRELRNENKNNHKTCQSHDFLYSELSAQCTLCNLRD